MVKISTVKPLCQVLKAVFPNAQRDKKGTRKICENHDDDEKVKYLWFYGFCYIVRTKAKISLNIVVNVFH